MRDALFDTLSMGSPEVLMKDSCPMVSASWANQMIKELDEHFKGCVEEESGSAHEGSGCC